MDSSDLRTRAVQLARIRRGVRDPERCAEFYEWLLGIQPVPAPGGYRLPCMNGDFLLDANESTPVAIGLTDDAGGAGSIDPDGMPVERVEQQERSSVGTVMLDHVSRTCANLAASVSFYEDRGFYISWSACGERSRDGPQVEPIEGADWVHVSGVDGYLALSQADWQEYGTHNAAAGPPRFIHVGLRVSDLAGIAAKLDRAGLAYQRVPQLSIGERIYLNDPEGVPALGMNVELIEYEAGVARSGVGESLWQGVNQ